jgi:hypothetical protein
VVAIIVLLRTASRPTRQNHFAANRGGTFIIEQGVDDEITGKRDASFFRNRRRNRVGADHRSGPDRPAGSIPRESGTKECDFKILQRPGQCQRTARRGAEKIQVRVQEGRWQTPVASLTNAAPDGYTLLLAFSVNAINATLYDNLNFDFIRDIAPVASITRETTSIHDEQKSLADPG